MKRVSLLIFLSIFLIFGSLIFFESKGAFSKVDSGIGKVFSPIAGVFSNYGSGFIQFFSNFSKISSLQKENKDLSEKVTLLESEVSRMKSIAAETDSLKKELDFKKNSGFETITAEIAFFDPSQIRETIIINKGQKDGVRTKMAVTSQGVLVGRVSDVFDTTSKIILINDPLSTIPAIVENTNILGLAQGQLGIGIAMNQIPVQESIKEGQLAVTSGLGGELPKGLIIGRIETIEKKNNSIFQTALLRPLVDLRLLERVQVIKSQ